MTCPFNGNDCTNTCSLHDEDGCAIAEMKNLSNIKDSLTTIENALTGILMRLNN